MSPVTDFYSDPRFRPFFAKAQELDVLIFMHPAGLHPRPAASAEHYFINVIGNPLRYDGRDQSS